MRPKAYLRLDGVAAFVFRMYSERLKMLDSKVNTVISAFSAPRIRHVTPQLFNSGALCCTVCFSEYRVLWPFWLSTVLGSLEYPGNRLHDDLFGLRPEREVPRDSGYAVLDGPAVPGASKVPAVPGTRGKPDASQPWLTVTLRIPHHREIRHERLPKLLNGTPLSPCPPMTCARKPWSRPLHHAGVGRARRTPRRSGCPQPPLRACHQ